MAPLTGYKVPNLGPGGLPVDSGRGDDELGGVFASVSQRTDSGNLLMNFQDFPESASDNSKF